MRASFKNYSPRDMLPILNVLELNITGYETSLKATIAMYNRVVFRQLTMAELA